MSLKDKAHRLVEYISQVCAIDLPVIPDVAEYKDMFLWQAEIPKSPNLYIKEFSEGNEEVIFDERKTYLFY